MSGLLSGGRRWLVLAFSCCATIAAASLIPIHVPETPLPAREAPIVPLSAEVAATADREDLGALLSNRRWGDFSSRPRKSDMPTVADPPSRPAMNPELLKMNYVGLIAVQDQRIVLIKVPGVGIVRYVSGDTLPDGRVLVSVTDKSLKLKAEGLPEEELMLFPPARSNSGEPSGPGSDLPGAEGSR